MRSTHGVVLCHITTRDSFDDSSLVLHCGTKTVSIKMFGTRSRFGTRARGIHRIMTFQKSRDINHILTPPICRIKCAPASRLLDKSATVRKKSLTALQALCHSGSQLPSRGHADEATWLAFLHRETNDSLQEIIMARDESPLAGGNSKEVQMPQQRSASFECRI